MADRYYGAGSNSPPDGNWNTGANWTGDTVPGSGDVAIFRGDDADEDTNCTCNVAIDVAGLTVLSTYSGKLDFADSSYSHSIAGDFTADGSGEVDCGNATITCSGNWDNKDQTTWTRGTSTVVLSGAEKTIIGAGVNYFRNLTVSGSYTIHADTNGSVRVIGAANISGSLVVSDVLYIGFPGQGSGTLTVSGSLTGASIVYLYSSEYLAMTGTHNVVMSFRQGSTFTATGTFSASVSFTADQASDSITFAAGTRTFTGPVTFTDAVVTRALTVNNSANPSFVFQAGVTITQVNAITWTAGTGTISFTGTNDQTITTPAGWTQALEDVVVNKGNTTAKVMLASAGGDLYTESFTGTCGRFDPNGKTIYCSDSATAHGDTGFSFHNGTDTVMAEGSKISVGAGALTLAGAA